jgi:alpha-tubulin suppressor-like RCC1 family protein
MRKPKRFITHKPSLGLKALRATIAATMLAATLGLTQLPADAAVGDSAAAWGWNALGQLGDATTVDSLSAGPVADLVDLDAVSAGGIHTLFLKHDGTVWASGSNVLGQLGNGTTDDSDIPVQVEGLAGVTEVSAGLLHNLAVDENGDVWAWGWNAYGQLGDNTIIDRDVPVRIDGLTDVKSVSAGLLHSMAVKEDGTVWTWGSNVVGQLGDGTTADRHTPVEVSGLGSVTQVSAGGLHSLALNDEGTAFAWGYNGMGQLGDGTTTNRLAPVDVRMLGDVRMVSAGTFHSLAIRPDGKVRAWGYNGMGQLGDNTNIDRLIPVTVLSGLTGVTSISAGGYHSLAAKNDGTLRAWGWNALGQLGDDTTIDRLTPIAVTDLTDLVTMSAGYLHSASVGSFDITAPVLALPADITTIPTGPDGAVVNYTATATDAVDGPVAVDCSPPSGSTFPMDTTQVNCSAVDAGGNTSEGSFTVTVQDADGPVLQLPDDITAEATGPDGAVVNYTATATDAVDGAVDVGCNPASGSTFPMGTTQVDCEAVDAGGNRSDGSFMVTVKDTKGPVLQLPDDITTIPTGLEGAVVTYTATATDAVDGPVDVGCSPPSGSTFPMGATTEVHCSAIDGAHNPSEGTFTVTVLGPAI